MIIKVTQEDIDKGFTRTAFGCPVARAMRAATGESRVCAGYSNLIIVKGDVYEEYNTPDNVRTFMKEFDDGNNVEPFEFELGK